VAHGSPDGGLLRTFVRRSPRRRLTYEPADPVTLRRRNRLLMLVVALAMVALLLFESKNRKETKIGLQLKQVEDDLLEIASALERYTTDNGVFPLPEPGIFSVRQLGWLTTPHPYLWDWSVTTDPFTNDAYRLGLWEAGSSRWVLISAGPDRRRDLSRLPEDSPLEAKLLSERLEPFRYDPSNGILSNGDVFHYALPSP